METHLRVIFSWATWMTEAYILDAVRTPIGRVNGLLAGIEVQYLLAPLIRALLQRNSLDDRRIDEVIIGNAAGPGGNPARLALLQAGLPVSVPGLSVDRQCGSGLEAINLGVRLVQSGAANLVLAGGVESASTAPLRARNPGLDTKATNKKSARATQCGTLSAPELYSRARFSPDEIGDPEMGIAAENVARRYRISRVRQDELAYSSHQKAIAARRNGVFTRELVPVRGNPASAYEIIEDECPRADTSRNQLAALAPAFLPEGSVTAGNACPVSDGAALVLISSSMQAGTQALRFVAAAAAGVDPNYLGLGPVPATRMALERSGMHMADLAQVEFNEAFAAQVLACADLLALDLARLNPAGGALALGHPYGASGAMLVTRLLYSLPKGACGLATIGIGGGMGITSVFEAV